MNLQVTNMTSPNTGNPVANQFIIITDEGTFFKSYNSIIAHKAKDGTITLGRDWDYSNTTLKYLRIFLDKTTKEIKQNLDNGVYQYDKDLKIT